MLQAMPPSTSSASRGRTFHIRESALRDGEGDSEGSGISGRDERPWVDGLRVGVFPAMAGGHKTIWRLCHTLFHFYCPDETGGAATFTAAREGHHRANPPPPMGSLPGHSGQPDPLFPGPGPAGPGPDSAARGVDQHFTRTRQPGPHDVV